MKKSQLIALLKDSCGLDYGDRTVAMHFNNCFQTIVGQLFSRDPNQISFYAKQVKLDVVNRVADISKLPIIQDASNAKGIVRIYPTGSECSCLPDDTEFFPAPAYSARSGAMANHLGWAVFYTVTSSRIQFNKSLNKDVAELYADCVLEFSYYSDDEMIPLPAGVGQMIIDATVQAVKGSPAHQNLYKQPKQT
jgi:hypothetical protein